MPLIETPPGISMLALGFSPGTFPTAPGTPVEVPPIEVPPGTAAGAALMLIGVLGKLLEGLEGSEPKVKRIPHQREDGKSDNTEVLKLYTAVEIVEDVLVRENTPLMGKLLLRTLLGLFKAGSSGQEFLDIKSWVSAFDFGAEAGELREQVFGPLADEIESRLRENTLQQQNLRQMVKVPRFERLGKIAG